MAKRIADKELTDRNWDQEEEGEEAGTFSVASVDVLKNRAIKKAKRRNIGGEAESSGAFKGFKGFALGTGAPAASTASTPTAFSGFGNGGGFKGLSGLTNGNNITPSFGSFSSPTASAASPGLTFNSPAPSDIMAKQTNGSAPTASQSSSSSKEYSRQLTALNCSVRDWITKHVNDNPLCDLNPIFRDYERHLATIERQYGAGAPTANTEGKAEEKKQSATASSTPPATSSASSSATSSSSSSATSSSSSSASSSAPAASLFSFGKISTDDSAREKTGGGGIGVTFNFGQKVDSSVLASLGSKATPPSFSFSSSSSSSSTSLFGAPGGAALSFSGNKSSDTTAADENGEDESEEPPKPEVKEVKEDDAFYSKKCKLFYKKETEFKEKGVGTLHLKGTDDGKTQMIIRADTNLGNILLNILVTASLPCSRLGKNNVMVVCVPNPAVDDKNPDKPVPLLIRVKTAEDADELLKTLEKRG